MLEEPLLGLQGKGNRLPLRTHLVAAEMKSAVQNLSQLEKDALEQGFKDADIFFSGTGKELYLNFGKAIGKNVVLAAAMVALGFLVPKEVNKVVNYGFDAYAIVELLAGNPAMALMTGGMELWKEFGVQAKREKYNIESDRDHGKVFGYVRDGKSWYPAYVDQHEKWHGGIGERGNDLDLVYGRELIMKILPDGTIEPDIMYPLGKRHVSGSDKDLLMSTKEVADKQSMRDWYLLGPDDMETVRIRGQDVVKPKAEMTVYKDDWSKYEVQDVHEAQFTQTTKGEKYLPAWWAANLDLRRSLDYMHHWGIGQDEKYGFSQHDSGIDPGLALMHSGAMHDMTDTKGRNWNPWPGEKDTYKLDEHWGGTHENSTNQYLLTTLLRQSIVKLQKSQFMAAQDAKYERSGPQVHVEGGRGEPGNWMQPGSEPWRNYVDFAKDLPGAQSSDELLDQLRDIDKYKDRSMVQKSYLGNKAIVRYLMEVISDRGGTDLKVFDG